MDKMNQLWNLKNRVVVITGGAGLLGMKHAEAIIEMGGIPILLDVNAQELQDARQRFKETSNADVLTYVCDITEKNCVQETLEDILKHHQHVDVLINNAAINPKIESGDQHFSRFENYASDQWMKEINVGLTGAFLCAQAFGSVMAKRKKGVIINVASDLGLIAPNQSLYKEEGLPDDRQPVKPITYSVIKHGLIGLTRYIATYWADQGIRCNALAPGGVFNGQDEVFVKRIQDLIPMRRMANADEYKSSIVFLASDASSYMTGSVLVVDGGRTCW
jgi:NAD(P)-dependent dehydrogenase (short-subunit alcohol dehydrogenase family)